MTANYNMIIQEDIDTIADMLTYTSSNTTRNKIWEEYCTTTSNIKKILSSIEPFTIGEILSDKTFNYTDMIVDHLIETNNTNCLLNYAMCAVNSDEKEDYNVRIAKYLWNHLSYVINFYTLNYDGVKDVATENIDNILLFVQKNCKMENWLDIPKTPNQLVKTISAYVEYRNNQNETENVLNILKSHKNTNYITSNLAALSLLDLTTDKKEYWKLLFKKVKSVKKINNDFDFFS